MTRTVPSGSVPRRTPFFHPRIDHWGKHFRLGNLKVASFSIRPANQRETRTLTCTVGAAASRWESRGAIRCSHPRWLAAGSHDTAALAGADISEKKDPSSPADTGRKRCLAV